MEKKDILWSNRQLSRTYSLFIINLILLFSAIILNYFRLNNNKVLYMGIMLDIIALVWFKPWKIMGDIRKLYASQRMLEELIKVKGEKNV